MIRKIFLSFQKRKLRKLRPLARTPSSVSRRLQQPPPSSSRKFRIAGSQWLRRDGWALGGIMLLILGTLYYFGIQSRTFILNDISISDLQFLNKEEVQNTTTTYLHSSFLGILPRNTYWTLSKTALQEYLQESFRDKAALVSVTVSKTYPNSLHITLEERIPSLVWITKSEDKKQEYYLVDHQGIVTQIVADKEEIHPSLPRVHDENRGSLGLQWHIIGEEYIAFVLQLQSQFEKESGMTIESYTLPIIDCKKPTIMAEQIFSQEIQESTNEEFRQKKRNIQEQFQKGLLSVDESLDALEKIKKEETAKMNPGKGNDNTNTATMKWQTVYIPTECDIVVVAHDVIIHATSQQGTINIIMDSTRPMQDQIQQLQRALQEQVAEKFTTIDVRLSDRIYFK